LVKKTSTILNFSEKYSTKITKIPKITRFCTLPPKIVLKIAKKLLKFTPENYSKLRRIFQ